MQQQHCVVVSHSALLVSCLCCFSSCEARVTAADVGLIQHRHSSTVTAITTVYVQQSSNWKAGEESVLNLSLRRWGSTERVLRPHAQRERKAPGSGMTRVLLQPLYIFRSVVLDVVFTDCGFL